MFFFRPPTRMATVMYGAANKGALALVSGGLLAIFNDDTAKLDEIVYKFRTLAHIGLRSSDDIGLLGDSLRDQGTPMRSSFRWPWLAEALWKQGIDVYSDYDNRLLAAGEYFARVNDLVTTPFLPFGTTDAYYTADNTAHGWGGGNILLNLIHGAYVVRKGLPAPYTSLRRQDLGQNGDSFMFLKEADPSTATPTAALTFPATTSITSGFSNVEIGGRPPPARPPTLAASGRCRGGHGYVARERQLPLHLPGDHRRLHHHRQGRVGPEHQPVRQSRRDDADGLEQGAPRAWMAVIPNRSYYEQNIQGLAVYGGNNYACRGYSISTPTYWVKLERLGNIITGYVSPTAPNWAATDVGRFNGTPRPRST